MLVRQLSCRCDLSRRLVGLDNYFVLLLFSFQVEGVVKEGLPSAMFRVEVGATGKVVLCTISGRIRKNFVRILVGDPVRVELSPYDLTRGRITFRYK